MFEAIRQNRSRSNILLALMAFILVALGAGLGFAFGGTWETAVIGCVIGLVVCGAQMSAALMAGESIVLAGARARKVSKEEAPQLINVVEEMTIASGLGTPPATYIIDDNRPNAFATGLNPKRAAVAVTTGLLKRLTRDELQGVIAHEIGHIKNEDTRFITIAVVMLGSIIMLSDIALHSVFYSSGSRRSNKGGGMGMVIILVICILAPILAKILFYACSRQREYLADASAARFTRYPEGLASALEKITGCYAPLKGEANTANRALAPMFIINPLAAHGASGLFSTHPASNERVKILRSMGGGAGYSDYERASRQVMRSGDSAALVGLKGLDNNKTVSARDASVSNTSKKEEMAERFKDVGSMLDRMTGFMVISCACGVSIKVPPNYKKETIPCVHCGVIHTIPAAAFALGEATNIMKDAIKKKTGRKKETQGLQFSHKKGSWDTFRCACGRTIQLSPSFEASKVKCPKCKTQIGITTV